MLRRLALVPLVLLALAALPACDSGSDAVGLTGTWEGEVTTTGGAVSPVEFRFTDTGATVTGTGTVRAPSGAVQIFVTGGSFVGTTVQLDLQFAGSPIPGTLSGTLTNRDPGRVEGTLSGPTAASGTVAIELTGR